MVSEVMILFISFYEVAMVTNSNRPLNQIQMFGRGLLKEHFSKPFSQNICNEIKERPIFPFLIISLWKLKIAIATKAHEQWQRKTKF